MADLQPELSGKWTPKRLRAVDSLSVEKWMARSSRLTPIELQRETLRQTTDAKLQLMAIRKLLRVLAWVFFLPAVLATWVCIKILLRIP